MKRLQLISILMSVIFFFCISFLTLSHYGINWDTINHLPRGQAFLHFFLTGKTNYNDIPSFINKLQDPETLSVKTDINEPSRRSIYQSNNASFDFFIMKNRYGHPPVSDILSSFFNLVLFQKLGFVNDIDSYRVYGILLASCLVGLIFFWGYKISGWFAGLISALTLATYPLFWAESHFNTEKDIPETVFWSFFLFAVWKGVNAKSWKWILLSGIFFGLGLGTKFNIIFTIPIIVFYVSYIYFMKLINFKSENLKLLFVGLVALLLGVFIFYISWPYLWSNPLDRIKEVINYYQTIGLQGIQDSRFVGVFGINLFPIQWIFFTTPPTILFLSVMGIIGSLWRFFKVKDSIALLLLLWLVIPILRVSIPGANIYGGVRQIMEFVPALALLSGLGAMYIIFLSKKIIKSPFINEKLIKVLIVLLFIPVIYQLLKYHPYENVYFNFFIGGLKGAQKINFPYWGTTFGSPYRDGAIWLNKNTEKGAKIVYIYDLYPNIPRIFLRRDLILNNKYRSGDLARGEYAVGLIYQGSIGRTYYDSYLERYVIPVYEIKVDEVTLLKIWKNDKAHQKNSIEQIKVLNYEVEISENKINIKLPKLMNISKFVFMYPDFKDCSKDNLTYSEYSVDGISWIRTPVSTTEETPSSILKNSPQKGKYIISFASGNIQYLKVITSNNCLLKYTGLDIFENSNLKN